VTVLRFMADGPPIATNQGYEPIWVGRGRKARPGFKLSTEGMLYKQRLHVAGTVAWARAGRPAPLERAIVGVRFGFRTHANDIDGPLKFALDAVQASRLVVNDNRVLRVVLEKVVDGDLRTEVGVAALDAPGCPHCGCQCRRVIAP
jgi:Holliday junction resolvase RusA-like endonuclease